jgi:hypothetical protein
MHIHVGGKGSTMKEQEGIRYLQDLDVDGSITLKSIGVKEFVKTGLKRLMIETDVGGNWK